MEIMGFPPPNLTHTHDLHQSSTPCHIRIWWRSIGSKEAELLLECYFLKVLYVAFLSTFAVVCSLVAFVVLTFGLTVKPASFFYKSFKLGFTLSPQELDPDAFREGGLTAQKRVDPGLWGPLRTTHGPSSWISSGTDSEKSSGSSSGHSGPRVITGFNVVWCVLCRSTQAPEQWNRPPYLGEMLSTLHRSKTLRQDNL